MCVPPRRPGVRRRQRAPADAGPARARRAPRVDRAPRPRAKVAAIALNTRTLDEPAAPAADRRRRGRDRAPGRRPGSLRTVAARRGGAAVLDPADRRTRVRYSPNICSLACSSLPVSPSSIWSVVARPSGAHGQKTVYRVQPYRLALDDRVDAIRGRRTRGRLADRAANHLAGPASTRDRSSCCRNAAARACGSLAGASYDRRRWISTSSSSAPPGARPPRARARRALLMRRGGDRLLFDCGEGTQRQLLRSSVGLVDLARDLPHPLPRRPLPRAARDAEDVRAARARGAAHDLRSAGAPRPVRRARAGSSASSPTRRARRAAAGRRRSSATATAARLSGRPRRVRRRLRARRGGAARPLRRRDGRRARRPAGAGARRPPARRDGHARRRPRRPPEQVLGRARPGRTIVFTGDTAPSRRRSSSSSRGADLLVHEATFWRGGARARRARRCTRRRARRPGSRATPACGCSR